MGIFKNFIKLCEFNFFIALSAVGLCWLQIRHQILSGPAGLVAFSRSINVPRQDLDVIAISSFYLYDFLICSIALPFILSLSSKVMHGRAKSIFIFSSLLVYMLSYLVIAISLSNIGSIPSIDLIIESIQWAINNPSVINEYIDAKTFLKFILITLLAIYILRFDFRKIENKIIVFFISIIFISATSLAYSKFIGYTEHPISKPVTTLTIESLVDSRHDSSLKNESLENLQIAFDIESKTERPMSKLSNKRNIVFIILETAPSRLYTDKKIYEDLKDTFKDRYLYSMKNHHTTFPYTSDGIYSILTSLYPEGRRRILKTKNSPIEFGWLKQLSDMGYTTTNYTPIADTFEPDSIMYSKFGVQNRVIYKDYEASVRKRTTTEGILKASNSKDVLNIVKRDFFIFEKSTEDALKLFKQGRNFVFLLTPQIGHSPWPNLNFLHSNNASVTEKIWRLQHIMINNMVNEFRANGLLEDTIIVVTSDHGVRTKQEFEDFEIGRVTDLSYKVPLFIYSSTPLPIDNDHRISSHVDIGPSALEWLGVKDSRKFVEGVSFSSKNDLRNVYFFGKSYLGVEGFYDTGLYFSYSYNTSICESSADLQWRTSRPATKCENKIEKFYKIHNSVINKYVFGG